MERIVGLRELTDKRGVKAFIKAMSIRTPIMLPIDEIAEGRVVWAEINHGRWVGRCPFCNGAELVDLEQAFFYCLSCFNAMIDHRWLRIKLPRDRDAIEAVLLQRPLVETRNWHPGETVTALRAKNAEKG